MGTLERTFSITLLLSSLLACSSRQNFSLLSANALSVRVWANRITKYNASVNSMPMINRKTGRKFSNCFR